MRVYSSWGPVEMSVVGFLPCGLKPLALLITGESKGLVWFNLGVKSSSPIRRTPEHQSLFSFLHLILSLSLLHPLQIRDFPLYLPG